jgi:hypothetical protein
MTIEEAILKTNSMAQAAALLGMKFSTFKRKAGSLYVPNQGGKGSTKPFVRNGYGEKREILDILEGRFPTYPTNKLKKRLLEEGFLVNKCSECGLSDTWNGNPIVLQLDHINGINNDHRLENVRLLCPNCHSQTDTWCGKGKRKPV